MEILVTTNQNVCNYIFTHSLGEMSFFDFKNWFSLGKTSYFCRQNERKCLK